MRWPLLIILAPLALAAVAYLLNRAAGALQRARDDHEGGAPLPKREDAQR